MIIIKKAAQCFNLCILKLWLYVQVETNFFLASVIWYSPPYICAFDNFPKQFFFRIGKVVHKSV